MRYLVVDGWELGVDGLGVLALGVVSIRLNRGDEFLARYFSYLFRYNRIEFTVISSRSCSRNYCWQTLPAWL